MTTAEGSPIRRLQQAYLQRERAHKLELAVVGVVWLLGCPLLALTSSEDSLYGNSEPQMCGLYSYSVSASMTGLYPKIFGSLLATHFAVLVMQRNTNGLVALLKLGWMVRFSSSFHQNDDNKKIDRDLAVHLWQRLIRIEVFGYLSGVFLIALVILDAQYFPNTHNACATLAFACLFGQNYLIGSLERDFPKLFNGWTHAGADYVLLWAFGHFTVMGMGMTVLGFLSGLQHCEKLNNNTLLLSLQTSQYVASIMFWANEYIFGLLCIYIQLFQHWEIKLWEFVGDEHMPVAAILSRFSLFSTVQRMIHGGSRRQAAELLLGMMENDTSSQNDNSQTAAAAKEKMK